MAMMVVWWWRYDGLLSSFLFIALTLAETDFQGEHCCCRISHVSCARRGK